MRWNRGLSGVLLGTLLLTSAAVGAPTSTHVRFTAVGDFAATTATGTMLQALDGADPDAHFALGDLSYGATGAESTWCDFVTSRVGAGFPFELISGNHESNGQNGNINDFSACLPNQLPGLVGTYGRQYYVDVPQVDPLVRFVMISPDLTFPSGTWSYPTGSARYAWTAATIDDARADGVPWVVVGMHKPCLSLGQYSCEVGADLITMLMAKKVDVVLSGHEHNYQRTKQLSLGQGCLTLPAGSYAEACVEDADNDLTAGAGTVFVTVGTGGTTLRDITLADPELPYFAAYDGANLSGAFGYAEADVTPDVLSMAFTRTSGGSFADSFTLTRDPNPPPNQLPTAAFTSTVDGLSVDLDAGTSADLDGFLTSYEWDFGDGESASGPTPSHSYAGGGDYDVTLTVTDDDGATDAETLPLTVAAPPPGQVVAADQWERTLTNAWGPADIGGAWTVSVSAGVSSVSGGLGRTTMRTAGARPVSSLNSLIVPNVDLAYEFSLDKLPLGTGTRVDQGALLRRNGASEYRAIVRVLRTGAIRAVLSRAINGAVTQLDLVDVPGTYAAGSTLEVRAQVSGTAMTDIRLKVWPKGDLEPTGWTIQESETTPAALVTGSIGLAPSLASGTTNAPVQARYDDLHVTTP